MNLSLKAKENLIIYSLSFLLFFHMVEFIIIMPLGPELIRTLKINAQQFSFLISVYSFTAAASGVSGLFWMDRLDRKLCLLLVNILFSLGTAACFFSESYEILLFARSFTGAFGGILGALCMTIIGDLVPIERRGFAMGKLMSAFSLATVAGIPLGLKIASMWNWQAPFLFVSLGSIAMGILAYLVLPNIRDHLENKFCSKSQLNEIKDVVLNTKHIASFSFIAILMLGQFTVIPFLSPIIVQNSGYPEKDLSMLYFIGGLFTAFTTPLIGRLADRFGKKKVFQIVAFLALIPIALLTHLGPASKVIILLITTLFFIFVSGRMSPAMALMTEVVDKEKRGRFMSLNSAFQQAFAGIASSLAGFIIIKTPEGNFEGFEQVGYISLSFIVISIFWVNILRAHNSTSN